MSLSIVPSWIQPANADGKTVYSFYYGVPNGEVHLLPVNAYFDMIFSPNPCQREPHWSKTRFQVVESRDLYGKNKGKISRKYQVLKGFDRELRPDEIAEMEGYIAQFYSESREGKGGE